MARKRFTAEQIIGHLRQAEVMVGQGKSLHEVLRAIDVTANTYYRWRKEYGGMGMDQARRLTDMQSPFPLSGATALLLCLCRS